MSDEPTRSTFTKVPHWLLPLIATGMLKPQTLQVYAAIGMYVDWSTGKGAFPGVPLLSRVTGMSERTVQRHTSLLIAVGAIKSFERFRSDGGQTSNEVWLMEDPPEEGVSPVSPPRHPLQVGLTPVTPHYREPLTKNLLPLLSTNHLLR
jgi:hypothetical protein